MKELVPCTRTSCKPVPCCHASIPTGNFRERRAGYKTAADLPMLGTREWGAGGFRGEYIWQSWAQVERRLTALGSALNALGICRGDMVGLYAANCADWVVAEQACNAYSLVAVPLYDTLGNDSVEFILQQTEMKVMLVASDKLEGAVEASAAVPSLQLLIEMDGCTSIGAPVSTVSGAALAEVERWCSNGLHRPVQRPLVVKLSTLEQLGRARPLPHIPPKPTDVCTICYTSGTTGVPKGAILTHGNFAAGAAGAAGAGVDLVASDVHISYLPLAHVFERLVQVALIRRGGSIGFYQGDVTKLVEDLGVLRPTLFPSVPRLWNRIYDKVMAGVAEAGGLKATLFNWALSSKMGYLPAGHVTHSLWDSLVFANVRKLFGGRVRLMITGSAPIASDVKNFLQVAFCARVLEGYGLTETVGAATITDSSDFSNGHVGAPIACTELKLVDLPEMKYTSADKPGPRGEVCLRGPNIFKGYFKRPEVTAEVIDQDGWFHTGDVGRINASGTLSIIDRKKNIFKLAQGEYVAPEKIENVYTRAPLVAQCFVYGDSLKAALVAVVVLDPDVATSWGASNGLPGSAAALASRPELKDAVQKQLLEAATEAGLKGFEQARAFVLEGEPFSVENNCLTPTFKLKRPQLQERYQAHIDQMYSTLG